MAKIEYNQQSSLRGGRSGSAHSAGKAMRASAGTATRRTTQTATSSTRTLTNAQKVEELKLGKFAECKPLRLPGKQIRRGWQITWGMTLLLAALLGIYILFMIDPIRVLTWDNDGFVGGRIGSLQPYWWAMVGALVVATLCCLAAGIILLVKRRVPVVIWCLLIIAATVAALCASFHTFTWFEARNCYENYPGIYLEDPNKGSGCPSVMNDLIGLSLRNLVIYTVGLIALCGVWRLAKRRVGCGHRKKQ